MIEIERFNLFSPFLVLIHGLKSLMNMGHAHREPRHSIEILVFFDEVNAQFNKTTKYKGNECMLSYVMLPKIRELAQYPTGKKKIIDFKSPKFV